MFRGELAQRVEAAKRRASGNWPSILERLGVDAKVLGKRNQPCPACGGKDRFQFTDKYGDGNYVCRGCGPGDGFALLQRCLDWKFIEALQAVEDLLGIAPDRLQQGRPGASATGMRQLAMAIWQEAKPVQAGDAVATYLARRGIVLARVSGGVAHAWRARLLRQGGRSDACQAGGNLHRHGGRGAVAPTTRW